MTHAPPELEVARAHLNALGADTFAHHNGSLADHLQGTERLLRRFGARDALCVAGLYHAVYGTDGIVGSLVTLDARESIVAAIGRDAEALVYLFGACARDRFHPRIGTAEQLTFVDRFTRSEYPIGERELRDFCEITIANELDLALGSARFRARHAKELSTLLARMRGLITDALFAAARETFHDREGASERETHLDGR